MKEADRDILCLLAEAMFMEEMGSESAPQFVVTIKRLAREAGYQIPDVFDWGEYISDD